MALDGILFYKLAKELKHLETGRINKIQEASENEFLFTIRRERENLKLLISLSANYPRIHLTEESFTFPLEPKSFTMLLRKMFEGATISNIETNESDRIFILSASKYNEMGDFETRKLIVEIMGRYSNLIIVENNVVKEAFRHLGIGEIRTILPNSSYEFPDTLSKINPMDLSQEQLEEVLKDITTPKGFTSKILGLSLVVAEECLNHAYPVKALYEIIHDSTPNAFTLSEKLDFSYTKLGNTEQVFDSFSKLLDSYYKRVSLSERIKNKTDNIESFIDKQLKRIISKKSKLLIEEKNTQKADEYRLKGELLIANNYQKVRGDKIEVLNYYTNENMIIELDPRYDIMGNSKLYFKRYQKAKNAISHINEQLSLLEDELDYFNLLKAQIAVADLKDVLEIKEELIKNKYIIQKGNKERLQAPKITSYELASGAIVQVGKNNLQNDLVTNKLSHPQELWFHVKDSPGSHVVLKKNDDYLEEEIRICANLAAYYSPLKDSSSVPVNYTKIKNIKKIPGKKNCFVRISGEKTIYIDPDKNLIEGLKQVK